MEQRSLQIVMTITHDDLKGWSPTDVANLFSLLGKLLMGGASMTWDAVPFRHDDPPNVLPPPRARAAGAGE